MTEAAEAEASGATAPLGTSTDPVADALAWAQEGSAVLGALWGAVETAGSAALLGVLDVLARPQEGLQPALSDLVRRIEQLLGKRYGKGPIKDDMGNVVGAVEWRSGSTSWDVDALLPVLLAQARDERKFDPDTGEALEDEYACAFRVLKEVASISYFRVGALEPRGIDPGEYRQRGQGRWAVNLP